jgi:hypothetical protein
MKIRLYYDSKQDGSTGGDSNEGFATPSDLNDDMKLMVVMALTTRCHTLIDEHIPGANYVDLELCDATEEHLDLLRAKGFHIDKLPLEAASSVS